MSQFDKAERLVRWGLVERIPPEGQSNRTHFIVHKHLPFNKFERDVFYNPKTERWSCDPCFWMDNYGPAQFKNCQHIIACDIVETQYMEDARTFMGGGK